MGPDDGAQQPEREEPPAHAQEPRPQDRAMQRRQRELARKLAGAEERKLRARRRPEESVWFGLGTFGLVGWSVAVPTLVCLAIGIWIDSHYQSRFSWTLILLFAGITIGCLNAWYWVTREREQIERRRDEDDGG